MSSRRSPISWRQWSLKRAEGRHSAWITKRPREPIRQECCRCGLLKGGRQQRERRISARLSSSHFQYRDCSIIGNGVGIYLWMPHQQNQRRCPLREPNSLDHSHQTKPTSTELCRKLALISGQVVGTCMVRRGLDLSVLTYKGTGYASHMSVFGCRLREDFLSLFLIYGIINILYYLFMTILSILSWCSFISSTFHSNPKGRLAVSFLIPSS